MCLNLVVITKKQFIMKVAHENRLSYKDELLLINRVAVAAASRKTKTVVASQTSQVKATFQQCYYVIHLLPVQYSLLYNR